MDKIDEATLITTYITSFKKTWREEKKEGSVLDVGGKPQWINPEKTNAIR